MSSAPVNGPLTMKHALLCHRRLLRAGRPIPVEKRDLGACVEAAA